MRATPRPTPSSSLVPAAAPSAGHAGLSSTTWSMPLPPPPHGRPVWGPSRPASPRLGGAAEVSPDLDSPVRHEVSSSSEFVPATPSSGAGCSQPGFVPAAGSQRMAENLSIQAVVGRGHNCSSGLQSTPILRESSMPPAGARREGHDEGDGGWQMAKSRGVPRRSALPAFKPAIPSWLYGRCGRCLDPGHKAAVYRDPLRCSRCLQNGHRARGCRQSWRPLSSLKCLGVPSPPLPHPARAVLQELVPRFGTGRGWPLLQPTLLVPTHADQVAGMPRLGDAASRTKEDLVVVPATPEMQTESALLATNAAVAWFEGDRDDKSCEAAAAAVVAIVGARQADINVVHHYPEQLLIRFMYQHHCALAIDRGYLPCCGSKLFICAWRLEGVSAAKEGELLVCRSLGIMQDDEDITERALDELAARFKEQLPMDVMATPQALFKVDDDNTREMDDALFVHAGSSGLEDEVAPADGDAQAT
ncbi:hypothetical protein D1007_35214 [Hordeum vulgare]|nr:hypothetical protein D1007_35214 [Hordeum vulgare]